MGYPQISQISTDGKKGRRAQWGQFLLLATVFTVRAWGGKFNHRFHGEHGGGAREFSREWTRMNANSAEGSEGRRAVQQ